MNYFNKFIFACLFAFAAAFAQNENTHFGIRFALGMAGLNFPTSVEEEIDGSDKLAIAIGGVLSMPLSESVTFAPELLFSYAAMPGDKSSDIRLDAPVLFKFYPLDYIFLQIGPQIGFSAYYADDVTGKRFKDRNPLELGPVFGFGYQIDANSTIDIRYYYGMTEYFDIISSGAQSYQLFAGYNYLF